MSHLGRVRWGLFATPIVRLACGPPVDRALLPPVRPHGPQASRNAYCRDEADPLSPLAVPTPNCALDRGVTGSSQCVHKPRT
jgi:hypothetical protein